MQTFYGVVDALDGIQKNGSALWGYWHTELCSRLERMGLMQEYRELMDGILDFKKDNQRIDELYHCLERFGTNVNEVKSLVEFQRLKTMVFIERVYDCTYLYLVSFLRSYL